MLARELKLWSSLRHPNILPLYGFINRDHLCQFSFVSEWMENGRADKYVLANPEYNVSLLVNDCTIECRANLIILVHVDPWNCEGPSVLAQEGHHPR